MGGYIQSYGSEVGMYMKAPEVCLGNCPVEAPCQHPSGGCVPRACTAAPVAPVGYAAQSYGGTQQSGYRQLQQGYGQQQTYAAPTQSYGYAVSAPAPKCGCPVGTIDMSCSRLGNRVVLWIAFALLFLPALWFFFQTWNFDPLRLMDDGDIDDDVRGAVEHYRLHRLVAGIVCFIASLAYLTMSMGYGYTVRCCDGRQFYYARYVDWTITTPLMLWEIVDYTNAPQNERIFLLAMDVLMIIGGLIGALVCGGEKWAFFGFSILCFIPILWFLCALEAQAKEGHLRIFRSIMNLTVLSWFFYPVVWILAEGTGVLCANAEAICYTVLDIISKSVFGAIIVNHPWAFMKPTDSHSML